MNNINPGNRIRCRTSSSVVEFDITTDTITGVQAACAIALSAHSSAGFFTTDKEEDGSTSLTLSWSDTLGQPLAFPLRTKEELAEFILRWLSEQKDAYGNPGYSGDGDNLPGLRLTNKCIRPNSREFYYVICAKPEWIYYGK